MGSGAARGERGFTAPVVAVTWEERDAAVDGVSGAFGFVFSVLQVASLVNSLGQFLLVLIYCLNSAGDDIKEEFKKKKRWLYGS